MLKMNKREAASRFAVGDRVSVYHCGYIKGEKGSVTQIFDSGEMSIRLDASHIKYTVWPQQCRRLKPRKAQPTPDVVINDFHLCFLSSNYPATLRSILLTTCEDDALIPFHETTGTLTFTVNKPKDNK